MLKEESWSIRKKEQQKLWIDSFLSWLWQKTNRKILKEESYFGFSFKISVYGQLTPKLWS
jgi:hypothetical protein